MPLGLNRGLGRSDREGVSIHLRCRLLALLGIAGLVLSACAGGAERTDDLPEGFGIRLSDEQLAALADDIEDPEMLAAFGLEPGEELGTPPSNLAFGTALPAAAETPPAPEPEPEPTPEPTPIGPDEAQLLSQRWWQWAAQNDWVDSPLTDPTGLDCSRSQPGDVWFLAPYLRGQADRTCTVPAGVDLVVPLLSRWCSPPLDDGCSFTNPAGAVLLDGESLDLVRVDNADPYEIVGIAENPVTPGEGAIQVVDTGWWASVEGLAPGNYELVVWAESDEFESAVRYELEVIDAG